MTPGAYATTALHSGTSTRPPGPLTGWLERNIRCRPSDALQCMCRRRCHHHGACFNSTRIRAASSEPYMCVFHASTSATNVSRRLKAFPYASTADNLPGGNAPIPVPSPHVDEVLLEVTGWQRRPHVAQPHLAALLRRHEVAAVGRARHAENGQVKRTAEHVMRKNEQAQAVWPCSAHRCHQPCLPAIIQVDCAQQPRQCESPPSAARHNTRNVRRLGH